MLVNADFKQLEIVCAFYLSKDKTGYKELTDGVDIHEENRVAFNLPTRLVAKTFKFRLIYGGSAYSYANDPDFADVGLDQQGWQKVIDKYYKKYYGLKAWHDKLVETAMLTGRVEIPTGRQFTFVPDTKYGKPKWPITTILNYPVQGFGADLMLLARLLVNKELIDGGLKDQGVLPVSTVHDSLVYDVPDGCVDSTVAAIKTGWSKIPGTFEQIFGLSFDLPCRVEIGVGPNLKDLTDAN